MVGNGSKARHWLRQYMVSQNRKLTYKEVLFEGQLANGPWIFVYKLATVSELFVVSEFARVTELGIACGVRRNASDYPLALASALAYEDADAEIRRVDMIPLSAHILVIVIKRGSDLMSECVSAYLVDYDQQVSQITNDLLVSE